jgi:hypothetical protein
MASMRRLLALLVVAVLLCALASPNSPHSFAAILSPLLFTGFVLITLATRRVFESRPVPSTFFALPLASRAPPLN